MKTYTSLIAIIIVILAVLAGFSTKAFPGKEKKEMDTLYVGHLFMNGLNPTKINTQHIHLIPLVANVRE